MSPDVLRLIDANLNRAREGLRTVEDFCRFAWDDAALSGRAKTIRHELAAATATLAARAVVHRDTPGDVGTTLKTSDEHYRTDAAHVVTAACKRAGEALRVIEEFAKVLPPLPRYSAGEGIGSVAAVVESLRYRLYDLERAIALRSRPLAARFRDVRLYVLITESACAGRPWPDVAAAAIAGGADCVQLREKHLDGRELLGRARRLVALCRERDVLCIVNDRADVAQLADADGVHLGQGDLSVADARRIVGDKLVGVSTHTIEQARQAVTDGADHIGVGPIYRSETKPRAFVSGLDFARQVAAEIAVPSVAIAGITLDRVGEVRATGMKAVAVTAAVCAAPDVSGAARTFRERLPV